MRQLTKTLTAATVLLAVLFTILILSQTAEAQQPPGTGRCDELQVVFLVDDSGSMSLKIEDVPPSDPSGLRSIGPAKAVETLSSLRYQTYQTATIRVAVIHFGSQPALGLPWTTLTVTNQSEHEALQTQLAPYFKPVPEMGNTNHLAAYQAVSSLFDQAPPQKNGCPTRAVILTTDGQSYLPNEDFNWATHLQEVADYVHQYMSPPGHQVYVIGIDKGNTFWKQNAPYWEKVVGDPTHATRAADQAHMGSLLLDIIDDLARTLRASGAEAKMDCVQGGTLAVPPFVQQIRLSLVKPATNLHIDLTDEVGSPVTPGRSDIAVTLEGYNEPIETMIINNPRPGMWNLRTQLPVSATERCQVRMLSFGAVPKLVAPADGMTISQFRNVPIDLRIVDTSGKPLPEYADPKYGLRLDVNLTGPSKSKQPLSLNAGPEYRFSGTIMPLDPGSNGITVRAVSQNPKGGEHLVFDKALANLQVTPVYFNLKEKPTGAVAQYRDLKLQFALEDAKRQPVQIDLTPVISVTIGRAGKPAQPLALNTPQNGLHEAVFRPTEAGPHVLSYQAVVNTARGTINIGREEITFDVFPTKQVQAKIVAPANDRFVATDMLLRPQGLTLEIQLADENGKELSPGQVGAVNPMSVFKIRVLDGKKNDRASEFQISNTGKPGLFRAENKTLGPGSYEVTVEPASDLGKDFLWADKAWTRQFSGNINLWFFALLAGAIAIIAAFVGTILLLLSARRHPLSGYVEVFQEVPEEALTNEGGPSTYRKTVYRQQLPRRNRVTLRPRGGKLPIKWIKVTCPTDDDAKAGRARIEAALTGKGTPLSVTLDPSQPPTSLTMGYFIEKGPRMLDLPGPDVMAAETYAVSERR